MLIFDEQNQEISEEDIDLDLGYLKETKVLTKILPEIYHYKVLSFVFDDGTSYIPADENDPHIRVIDASLGKFEYIPSEGDDREVKDIKLDIVIDQPSSEHYEIVYHYIPYTEEELVQRSLPNRVTSAEETLKETGLTVEDLILLMAEVLGGAEEVPEEESEEEE